MRRDTLSWRAPVGQHNLRVPSRTLDLHPAPVPARRCLFRPHDNRPTIVESDARSRNRHAPEYKAGTDRLAHVASPRRWSSACSHRDPA